MLTAGESWCVLEVHNLLLFFSSVVHLKRSTVALTVVQIKSDSDVMVCLQLLSKTYTCTLDFSLCQSIDHLCIDPFLHK